MHVSKLDNGLTVAVQPDPSVPLVTMDMWVKVGSGDEPTEIAGASHFLEHMLFKGTERLAAGEYDLRIEGMGGYLNAATSNDYTHYYVTVPSDQFAAALQDFADVLQNSAIDPTEVENERQVILEEIRRKNDNPMGYLFDATYPQMFDEGPYRHAVLGSLESVGAMTRDQLHEHYRRFYAAENMYLNIVGNVDAQQARQVVAEAFASLPTQARPWREKPPETVFAKPFERQLPREWNEAYFIIAFPGPKQTNTMKSMAVTDMAETLLATGRTSRLVNSIVEKKRLASNIGTYFMTGRNAGTLMIYGTCEPDKLPEVRAEVLREIEALAKEIRENEFARARRQAINSHLFSLETSAGRATTLGYSQLMLGNTRLLSDYDEALHGVTRHEVQQFLRTNLSPDRHSFFVTRRMVGAEQQ